MANRLGDACHRKDSWLHIVSKRKRHEVPHQAMQGHMERYQGCSGGEEIRKKTWAKAFPVVSAGQEGLGLDSLDNFSAFWGTGMIPNCPVPGPGVI